MKFEFQLKLGNRFETLQELDDIDTITYMIRQTALRVAKTTNKELKSRISTLTRDIIDETTRN